MYIVKRSLSIVVCIIYFLPMWSKMEAKLLTNGVAPGTVACAPKSAHLVRSIPGITPLRHGTLGFL
jgi:predicted secreted protein